MNIGALVAGESDVTDLTCLLGLKYGFHRSPFGKNAVRIGLANHFMELEQIDSIGLQPSQRFIELCCSRGFVSAVNLGHQEGFLAITIAQRLAHANFALAGVVVPAVIEKVDPFV